MKTILVIGNRVPVPARDGGAIATLRLLKNYTDLGFQVDFLTLNTSKHFAEQSLIDSELSFLRKVYTIPVSTNIRLLPALYNLFFEKSSYILKRFYNKKLEGTLLSLLAQNKYDWIHVESLFSATILPAVKAKTSLPIYVRTHNQEAEIWANNAVESKNLFKKFYFSILAKRLAKEEKKLLGMADGLLHISMQDKQYFTELLPQVSHHYLPFTIPLPELNASIEKTFTIGFIGSLEWLPNGEGLRWFLSHCWPKIRQQHPDLHFRIAGKGMQVDDPSWKNKEGLVAEGEIPDASLFMQSIALLVVPLFSGSGIRIKTLEAMSLGTPVITTAKGAIGIEAISQSGLFVANNEADFFSMISHLIANPKERQEAATIAREYIKNHHGIDSFSKVIQQLTSS